MIGERRKMVIKNKICDISVYLVIAFIVSIPLLISRYTFLLDFVPEINTGQSTESFYGKTIPIYGGHLLFDVISTPIQTEIFQKILIFISILLSGYLIHDLANNMPSSRIPILYAGILYTVNPYTYTRMIAGQWILLFTYAILPLSIKSFIELIEKKERKSVIKFTFFITLVAFNIHMLIISLIIMIIIFLLWFNKYKDIRITKLFAISGILFILLNSYWIIPILAAKNTIVDNITDKDYEVFAPKGSLFDIAAMYGFWREGYIYTKDFIPGWQILYLIILSLAIFGFLNYYKDQKIGYLVMAFGFIAILGLILALGIKGPLYPLYEFDNPILKGFRDSHKFIAMMVLAYAVLGGLGINKLEEIRLKIVDKRQV